MFGSKSLVELLGESRKLHEEILTILKPGLEGKRIIRSDELKDIPEKAKALANNCRKIRGKMLKFNKVIIDESKNKVTDLLENHGDNYVVLLDHIASKIRKKEDMTKDGIERLNLGILQPAFKLIGRLEVMMGKVKEETKELEKSFK